MKDIGSWGETEAKENIFWPLMDRSLNVEMWIVKRHQNEGGE